MNLEAFPLQILQSYINFINTAYVQVLPSHQSYRVLFQLNSIELVLKWEFQAKKYTLAVDHAGTMNKWETLPQKQINWWLNIFWLGHKWLPTIYILISQWSKREQEPKEGRSTVFHPCLLLGLITTSLSEFKSTLFGWSLSVYAIIWNTPSPLGQSLTGAKALPIHLPAASMNPLQSSSACLHLRLLQLSQPSSNFFIHSSFFSITSLCASCKLFSAASKAALTAFAASSKAWKRAVPKMTLNAWYGCYVIIMMFFFLILLVYGKFAFLLYRSSFFEIYKDFLCCRRAKRMLATLAIWTPTSFSWARVWVYPALHIIGRIILVFWLFLLYHQLTDPERTSLSFFLFFIT